MKLKNKPQLTDDQDFRHGQQNFLDLISYEGLEEKEDYLKIDYQYVRCLFISGFPFMASSGWLDNLIQFNFDSDLSYHLEEISSLQALPKLNRKITELESTKRTMLVQGKIIGSEITDPLDSAIDLRDKILRGQEKLFQVSIYIALHASSLDELNKLTNLLESTLASKLFFSKTARYEQISALGSILPRAENILKHQRNLDSSSAALTFPFVSSDLVQPNGVLYGINKSNNSLVIIDRFSLHNANSIIFAQSGSGKSYLSKIEIIRQMSEGTKIIVIDPEGEYKDLAENLSGSYIKVSLNSKQKINPFDLSSFSLKNKDILEHIQNITNLISMMVDGLNIDQKALVDKILSEFYLNKKLSKILFKDFYNKLAKAKEDKLCLQLDKYLTGSLSNLFSSPTNINLENRLIVFDIKDLSESIRPLMMYVISNFVANSVKNNQTKQLLVIDEAWLLFENPESARFIAGLVRRARKYFLGISLISQQANDFLSNPYGKTVASQSMLRILMRQDSTTIDQVCHEFSLSEYEREYLLTCSKGECLMIADQNHVAVKVIASKKEHPLITTDPHELFQI